MEALVHTGVVHLMLEWVSVTRDLGSVAECSSELRCVVESVARLRVGEIVARMGLEKELAISKYALGFGSRRAWRCVLSVYSRCCCWLRADSSETTTLDEDGNVLEWRDALGGGATARAVSKAAAPRLVTNGEGRLRVAFGEKSSAHKGLVLGGKVPAIADGVMLVVASVHGDSTVVDSGVPEDRFELCHGYPTDGNREQPRVCFTASSSGDPPRHALWGETRATGAWHVYTTVFGHKSWKRQSEKPKLEHASSLRAATQGGVLASMRRRLNSTSSGEARMVDVPSVSPRFKLQARSAALFVDSAIEGCADVGPNSVSSDGLTLGSDRNGSFRLRGDVAEFALWSGPVPASCLLALERALLRKHGISSPSCVNEPATRVRSATV